MTAEATLRKVPGGAALIDWFGRVHRFHDAKLLELNLHGQGASRVRLHTWRMTDKTDDQGFFILEMHAVVTIDLEQISYVELSDLNLAGIVFDLFSPGRTVAINFLGRVHMASMERYTHKKFPSLCSRDIPSSAKLEFYSHPY